MTRILHIARREWLEQVRQPAMLGSIGFLFAAIALLVSAALLLLDQIASRPELTASMAVWLPTVDGTAAVSALAGTVVSIANWLIFTQFLGITAVLAGHSILHDRETGALAFLLLAPVRRVELLAGKVLGALGPSWVLYIGVSGAASFLAAALPVTAPFDDRLPPSPAWVVAFLLGGPLWAAFVSAICVVVSSASRDVRTAQQAVWLVMFFATFVCGYLLAGLLPRGAPLQLGVAGLGVAATVTALGVGAQLIRRDLGR